MRTDTHGFTLIETLFAMAIAAVLSSMAVPSLEGHLQKARRTEVLAATIQIQGAQERMRSRSARYGDMAELGNVALAQPAHYTLQITNFDADGYALLATATGSQARDTSCRFMQARAIGMNLVYASGSDASVANDRAANRKCWSL